MPAASGPVGRLASSSLAWPGPLGTCPHPHRPALPFASATLLTNASHACGLFTATYHSDTPQTERVLLVVSGRTLASHESFATRLLTALVCRSNPLS